MLRSWQTAQTYFALMSFVPTVNGQTALQQVFTATSATSCFEGVCVACSAEGLYWRNLSRNIGEICVTGSRPAIDLASHGHAQSWIRKAVQSKGTAHIQISMLVSNDTINLVSMIQYICVLIKFIEVPCS
jgi:hypothetical protein